MGHSFTSFREKHIRSKDYKVEVWLFLIAKKFDAWVDNEFWLTEAIKHWKEQADLSLNGCIDPDLDAYLIDDYRVEILKEICASIQADLSGFGEMIPKEYLNDLCNYKPPYEIKHDNESELYLSYGRKLLDLLSGNQSSECENA